MWRGQGPGGPPRRVPGLQRLRAELRRGGRFGAGDGDRQRGLRVLHLRHGDRAVPEGDDGGLRCPLSAGGRPGPTHRRPRQPLPQLDLHQAPGVGDLVVHGQARDAARPRLQRLPVRLLPRQERRAPHPAGRQRQAQTE